MRIVVRRCFTVPTYCSLCLEVDAGRYQANTWIDWTSAGGYVYGLEPGEELDQPHAARSPDAATTAGRFTDEERWISC